MNFHPGDVVNRLTIVRRAVPGYLGTWICRCKCGNEKEIPHDSLRKGRPMSCGCVHGNMKHGHYRGDVASPTMSSWSAMIDRCYRPKTKSYDRYGGAGILVCDRWLRGDGERSGFECFVADMGERPSTGHSIDRWPDGAGNYEPANCRWATILEQQNNQKSNRRFIFEGKSVTLAELVRLTGVTRTVLKYRLIKHGWEIDRAITTPTRPARMRRSVATPAIGAVGVD